MFLFSPYILLNLTEPQDVFYSTYTFSSISHAISGHDKFVKLCIFVNKMLLLLLLLLNLTEPEDVNSAHTFS